MGRAAGILKHRVELWQPVTSTNTYGEDEITHKRIDTVYAQVQPLSGRERFYAQQVSAEITHRVTMRYRSDVDSSWRLVFKNRTLNIDSVINIDEANRWLELVCKEEA
ncbi:phage head closure protein [Planctomycetales bacterium ZRK34]|nr:phage head closure protein [Planctomycetales bacterium ZRK34]